MRLYTYIPMRDVTPFFAAFGPLLFGRPPRSFQAELRAQADKLSSLSQLRAAFGSLIPDALLSSPKSGAGSRRRRFTPLLTFWAFLAQVLSRDSACREAVRKVQAWWKLSHDLEISPSTSAYSQARRRLANKALEGVQAHLTQRMEGNVPDREHWRSRKVKIVDGTTASMSDTHKCQASNT